MVGRVRRRPIEELVRRVEVVVRNRGRPRRTIGQIIKRDFAVSNLYKNICERVLIS